MKKEMEMGIGYLFDICCLFFTAVFNGAGRQDLGFDQILCFVWDGWMS